MTSRYSRVGEKRITDFDYRKVYSEKFESNKKKFLPIKETIEIDYPSFNEILDMDFYDHIWTMGDRYYKLADLYYGNSRYWWIIAWFNKKPTESHINNGDIIRVPKSIGTILSTLGY